MVQTPGINAPQARLMAPQVSPAAVQRTSQARVMAPQVSPAAVERTSQARVMAPQVSPAAVQRVAQARVLVVIAGRIATPAIRASTFTLDGHDFYMLRLGDTSTLLYDLQSQEWVEWTSTDETYWRVNCGTNWIGGKKIGYLYGGTNIVVGDDTYGLLYFLDPNLPWDQNPDSGAAIQQLDFPRIIMAQTLVGGRDSVPCYAMFLSGDNYGITAVDFTPYVKLETSDDQGLSFTDQGAITIEPNTLDQDYRWTSLGQMASPGRLFRITDNGILTRIDSLEMNDAG